MVIHFNFKTNKYFSNYDCFSCNSLKSIYISGFGGGAFYEEVLLNRISQKLA